MNVSKFKCKFLKSQEIKQIVEDLRSDLEIENEIPVNIECIIEEGLGLFIDPEPGLKDLGIDAFLRSDLTGICVDLQQYEDERYTNRLRFSFAHELGHLLLHREIYKQFRFDTLREYYDFLNGIPSDEYGNFEWQANEFAGTLLVPREALQTQLDIACERINAEGLGKYVKSNPDSVLSRVSPTISKFFGVSDEVIERRVKNEKLWPLN